jgi:hypothetical protein
MLCYTITSSPERQTKTTIMSTGAQNTVDQNATALRVATSLYLSGDIDAERFKALIGPLDLTTDLNSHGCSDSGVSEAPTPTKAQPMQPSDHMVPCVYHETASSGTVDPLATTELQEVQQPITYDRDIFTGPTLSKPNKKTKKDKKDKKKSKGDTGAGPGKESAHLLCTACHRLWTVSELDSMMEKVAPDYYIRGYEMFATTRCPWSSCEAVSTSTIQDGDHQRNTTCFPRTSMAHAKTLFGKTHVPTIGWDDKVLYLTPGEIANLTLIGGIISSIASSDSNPNT